MEKRIVNPWTWQDEYNFVQAYEATGAQRVLYCSGQTALDGDGNPMHEGDMRAQFNLCLDNVETILEQAGYDLSHIVRLNIYTTDIDALIEAADVLGDRFPADHKPAGVWVEVRKLADPPMLLEIEATAVQ